MDIFILDSWVFFGLFVLLLIMKLLRARISLFIAIAGLVYFGFGIIIMAYTDDFNISPIIYFLLCCTFIVSGGKNVAYKTQTAVFDRITGKPTGVILEQGSWNFIDPIFEIATISVNGTPNLSADLQELKIKIHQTAEMQTKTRGIKVIIKHIVFMLEFTGNMTRIFDIEGGVATIKERIEEFIAEFLIDKIGEIDPVALDTDKSTVIHDLADELIIAVNEFCGPAGHGPHGGNDYPYRIVSRVTIGDIELEAAYYQALAKKALAILDQDAEDEIAKRLTKRLRKRGKKLLPSGSEADQYNAALTALKIVPRTGTDHKYGVDADAAKLLKEIAIIFAKK